MLFTSYSPFTVLFDIGNILIQSSKQLFNVNSRFSSSCSSLQVFTLFNALWLSAYFILGIPWLGEFISHQITFIYDAELSFWCRLFLDFLNLFTVECTSYLRLRRFGCSREFLCSWYWFARKKPRVRLQESYLEVPRVWQHCQNHNDGL